LNNNVYSGESQGNDKATKQEGKQGGRAKGRERKRLFILSPHNAHRASTQINTHTHSKRLRDKNEARGKGQGKIERPAYIDAVRIVAQLEVVQDGRLAQVAEHGAILDTIELGRVDALNLVLGNNLLLEQKCLRLRDVVGPTTLTAARPHLTN